MTVTARFLIVLLEYKGRYLKTGISLNRGLFCVRSDSLVFPSRDFADQSSQMDVFRWKNSFLD